MPSLDWITGFPSTSNHTESTPNHHLFCGVSESRGNGKIETILHRGILQAAYKNGGVCVEPRFQHAGSSLFSEEAFPWCLKTGKAVMSEAGLRQGRDAPLPTSRSPLSPHAAVCALRHKHTHVNACLRTALETTQPTLRQKVSI